MTESTVWVCLLCFDFGLSRLGVSTIVYQCDNLTITYNKTISTNAEIGEKYDDKTRRLNKIQFNIVVIPGRIVEEHSYWRRVGD